MLLRDVLLCIEAHQDERRESEQREYERSRFFTAAILSGFSKKEIKPHHIARFAWEKQAVARRLTAEEKERLENLRVQVAKKHGVDPDKKVSISSIIHQHIADHKKGA